MKKITILIIGLVLVSAIAAAVTYTTRQDAITAVDSLVTTRDKALDKATSSITYKSDIICKVDETYTDKCYVDYSYYLNGTEMNSTYLFRYRNQTKDEIKSIVSEKVKQAIIDYYPKPEAEYKLYDIKDEVIAITKIVDKEQIVEIG